MDANEDCFKALKFNKKLHMGGLIKVPLPLWWVNITFQFISMTKL